MWTPACNQAQWAAFGERAVAQLVAAVHEGAVELVLAADVFGELRERKNKS